MRRRLLLLGGLLLITAVAHGEGDPRRAQAFVQKGLKALEAGEVTKAQQLFEQAHKVSPQLPQPEILLGQVAMSQARYGDAEAHFQLAIELQVGLADLLERERGLIDSGLELDAASRGVDPRALAKAGEASSSAALQHQAEATRLGERVRRVERDKWEEIDSVPAELFLYLGNARMRLGRPADAVEPYQQAARRAPRFPEPHYNLAVALVQSGHVAEALEPCLRADEMGYPPAKGLLEHIRSQIPSSPPRDGE